MNRKAPAIAFLVLLVRCEKLIVGKTRDSVIIRCEIRLNKWRDSL